MGDWPESGWNHGVRHQSGARLGTANRSRHSAHSEEGRVGLGIRRDSDCGSASGGDSGGRAGADGKVLAGTIEVTFKQQKASKSTRAVPTNRGRWLRLWPYFLLMALACGVYSNALGNGFVSDDHIELLGNPLVTGWQKIPEIFQHGIWAFTGGAASNYYRPAQTVLYLALYSVFGFDAFAFHLVLVLIHGANTLLVYSLGRRLLKSRDAALVAGIVFAVHPIHSEAVVWIAVFPDVLLTAVVLAALLWFVRWDAAPRRGLIAGLAALFFLALLIKEPGAMLVPLLAGYEHLYLGRPVWRRENWALYASLMG